MLAELDKAARQKGLVQDAYPWEKVTREDIYRQRVLGTRTGSEDFIVYDDRRRHSWYGLVLYAVFVFCCMNFTFTRIDVASVFEVNRAIRTTIVGEVTDPSFSVKQFGDIDTSDDMAGWLVNLFPALVVPGIAVHNRVIGDIRLSLRRIVKKTNSDRRFSALAPTVWANQDGIQIDSQNPKLDDMNSFGVYRTWSTNLDQSESSTTSVSVTWCSKSAQCPTGATFLERLILAVNTTVASATEQCQRRCGELSGDWPGRGGSDKPCRCATLTGASACDLYFVNDSLLIEAATAAGDCPIGSLMPAIAPAFFGVDGVKAYWPLMSRFTYMPPGSGETGGWKGTGSFVLFFKILPQDELDNLANASGMPQVSQKQALRNQLEDWVNGGLLSEGSLSSFVVDFLVCNSNYQMFTHVQIIFRESATGMMTATLELDSLRIATRDLSTMKPGDLMAEGSIFDILLVVVLGVYIFNELVEILSRGSAHFSQKSNWFTIVVLLLVVATVIARVVFLGKMTFAQALIIQLDGNFENSFEAFDIHKAEYDKFRCLSGVCLLFVWAKMIRYLYDLVPSVKVQLDGIMRAAVPILFSVLIIFALLIAFSLGAFLKFGSQVMEFSSFGRAIVTCIDFIFGTVGAFWTMTARFPSSGGVFFVAYVVIFFFIAQALSKAIILASYSDALLAQEEEVQTRLEMQIERRPIFGLEVLFGKRLDRVYERIQTIKGNFGGPLRAHMQTERMGPSCIETCLFVVMIAIFTGMAYLMTSTGTAFEINESLSQALRSSTFLRENPFPANLSFDNISAHEDVTSYLQEALPKTLFESSTSTLFGSDNPLTSWQSASRPTPQLVINDWNVVVGQMPVRITLRYHKLTPASSGDAIGDIVPKGMLLQSRTPYPSTIDTTGMYFDPPMQEAVAFEDIIDASAQAAVRRWCGTGDTYGADELIGRGFSCMLSVNYTTTKDILDDFANSSVINSQTALVVLDFVVYNGFAESFHYVAVAFKFQPSGMIHSDIVSLPIQSDYYNTAKWYRVMLELVFGLLNSFFFIMTVRWWCKAIWTQIGLDRKRDGVTKLQILVRAIRAIKANASLDPWMVLDFNSSILNFIMLISWSGITMAPIASPVSYFFPEQPVVTGMPCTFYMCKDVEVIEAFQEQGYRILDFRRTLGVTTILLVLRALKYLQLYPHVHALFLILKSGSHDIFWVMVTIVVCLAGYVSMGHQILGEDCDGFQKQLDGIFSSFRMLMGTFNTEELQTCVPRSTYLPYTLFFIVIFRYIALNLFFAVIDTHFIRVTKADPPSSSGAPSVNLREWRQIRMKDLLAGRKLSAGLHSGYLRELAAPSAARSSPRSQDRPASGGDRGRAASFMERRRSASSIQALDSVESEDTARQYEAQDQAAEGALPLMLMTRFKIWRHLPEHMQSWAITKSKELSEKINHWSQLREQAGKDEKNVDKK